MSACIVLHFPRRRVLHQQLSRDATLRRCRLAGRVRGCNTEQTAEIERVSVNLLDRGIAPADVIEQAASVAEVLRHEQPASPT